MRTRALSLALTLLCAAAPVMAASSDEARAWIKRMSDAVVDRSYDGVLEHRWPGGQELLRVIHRKQGGVLAERVIFLGSNFEIIRNDTQFMEIDRKKGVIKAQTLTRSYGYLPAFNGVSADSDKHYVISNRGAQRLRDYAGQTQLITLEPRDELRYGYRFWLDQQSAMPIKTELVTASGVVIDEIFFQLLKLDPVPDEMLKPAFNKNPDWVKPTATTAEVKRAFLPRDSLLPPGFHVLKFRSTDTKPSTGPETRFMVSDGVNWVSVLVSVADEPQREGLARVSATAFQYVLPLNGHYIKVIGEAPPATVRAIAQAVRPE